MSVNRQPAQSLITHADVAIGAGGSATQLLPANQNRVTAIIYNVGTSNGARCGDSSAAASQGVPLPPASSSGTPFVSLDTTAAIYAYSASGTTVGVLEVVRAS